MDMIKNYLYNLKFFNVSILIILYYLILNHNNKKDYTKQKNRYIRKRVGIIGFMPDTNIGNNLLKYSIYIFLQYNGFNPILITLKSECNSYFLGKYLNLKEITNYNTELSENEYDILMVNSDQCWSYTFKNILSIGFLSFAINWKIPKFVYAASLGHDSWNVSNDIISSAKSLVKQFTGISVREETSIEIIKKKLGVEPYFVLDPTLLLNKSDYSL